ncbi:MAG: 23S rRNA (pseudouridine(1915)-N(3))-methyltransferase RlmH [Bacilli bacterium]|nr:23S rRNA (pseudouridine(1915)-N(3))-methyltransferase RlmH [Bacilli bacterium]
MIKIICVGKLKESYLKDSVNEYLKRLSKYTKVNIIEVNDISGFDIHTILKKEQEEILKNINEKDYVITLEIEGNQINSLELAKKIDKIFLMHSNIVFIIGGSYGLDDQVKTRANYRLSFSKLTFPHQLFRIMLLEQIYRVFKINNNEEYHK